MNLKRKKEMRQDIYEQKMSEHWHRARDRRKKEQKRLSERVNEVLRPLLEEETAKFDMSDPSGEFGEDYRNERIDNALRICSQYVEGVVEQCGHFSQNPKSSDLFASEFDEES